MRCSPYGRLRMPALCLRPLFPPLLPVLLALLLASCATRTATDKPLPMTPAQPPRPQPVGSLPGLAQDPLDGLRTALAQQCAMSRPPAHWTELCSSLQQAGVTMPEQLRKWLPDRFLARELVDESAPQGLITGYYEPLLTGSLRRERPDQVPLRGPPPDLLTIDLD
ncbi:MAG: MltA domain-containing protein, partial [Lautropia sp.]|nr:MltA domain-containing protein [Lautropia sp.]